MLHAKVRAAGLVTIPAEICKALRLEQGSVVEFRLGPGNVVELRPVDGSSRQGTRAQRGVTREDMDRALVESAVATRAQRKRVPR